jgi:hypothetical protein
MSKYKYIIITLPWFLLFVAAFIIIFKKQELVSYLGDPNKPLYDSIDNLHKEIVDVHIELDNQHKKYDSLLGVDKGIIIKHDEKIKFIYSAASTSDLDSIIRTAIKAKQTKH